MPTRQYSYEAKRPRGGQSYRVVLFSFNGVGVLTVHTVEWRSMCGRAHTRNMRAIMANCLKIVLRALYIYTHVYCDPMPLTVVVVR